MAPAGSHRAGRLRASLLAATAVLAVSVLLQPGDAEAQIPTQQHVLSAPLAQVVGYATPVVVIEKGGRLSYTNLDILQHDVVQHVASDRVSGPKRKPWCKSFPRGKCPVFWSKRAGLGETVAVQGLRSVKRGRTYTFFCTLHPSMRGRLLVLP